MAVNVFTEWGNLKEIVVGSVLNTRGHNVDLSFRLFYHQNIKHRVLEQSIELQKRLVEQREEDLNGIAETLSRMNVTVHRPEVLKSVKEFNTPEFSGNLRPMDNPRDLILVVGDKLIETPVLNRSRYFETDLAKTILHKYFLAGSTWICAPRPLLRDTSFDFSFVKDDPGNQDWQTFADRPEDHEILFDAAQCVKMGRHLLMNVSTRNHLLGAKWLAQILGDKHEVVTVGLTDHHIDGMLMPLAPGKLLISEAMKRKTELLPIHLQKWDLITFDQPENTDYGDGQVTLASANISVNVLPISEKLVMLFSPSGEPPMGLVRPLERNGFDTVTVRLRHSKVFDGGLHCATLDTVREDKLEDYWC